MNIYKKKIDQALYECDKHVTRMESAYNKMKPFFPLTNLSYPILTEDQIEHIDQYVYRFTKLQDTIGERFMKNFIQILQENTGNQAFIDILNRFEKIGMLQSVDTWLELRELRNILSHQYDDNPELMSSLLNRIFQAKNTIFDIYKTLKQAYLNRNN